MGFWGFGFWGAGGSPALSGGDLIGAGSSLVVGAAAVAAAASGRGGSAGRRRTSLRWCRSRSERWWRRSARRRWRRGCRRSRTSGAAGCLRRVREGPGEGSGFGNPRQPEPPAGSAAPTDPASPSGPASQSGGAAGKAHDTLGAMSSQMRNLGRRLNTVLPPDHAPHSTPPRMDIDHHE